MTEPTKLSHVSSFDLDLFEMGALEEGKRRLVEEHLRACASCKEEHDTLRASRADFAAHVLPRTAQRVRERAAPEARLIARPAFYAPALASAAALALWVATGTPGLHRDGAAFDAVQTKGSAQFQIVARRDGRVFPLDKFNRQLGAGDELRFVVTTSNTAKPNLLIASVDGAGRVTTYFPYEGPESAHVNHPGRWEVPGSIVLDDAPGPERIFAFFSKEPLAAPTVTRPLSDLGRRGWDAIRTTERVDVGDVEQVSIAIEKNAAP